MREEHAASLTGAGSQTDRQAASVGVIGLGYVGLPFALAFVRSGIRVTGIEVDGRKLQMLRGAKSYIQDISNEELEAAIFSGGLTVSDDYSLLATMEAVVLCVPTPLTEDHAPDLSYVSDTCRSLRPFLREGQLVVLESTTYPGTTKEIVRPLLEQSGLQAGVQFHLAYSPERIDPGNQSYTVEEVPKIVSGLTASCLNRVADLYGRVFRQVVPVSSTDSAEAAKLLENSFRLINISFMNEFAMLCDQLGVNVWEVIEAADTKPYGFHAFYPGPGIGGHCIPVDPLYLQWKARQSGTDSRFIELSKDMNDTMPDYIAGRIERLLQPGKKLAGASILLCGVTYKKDVADMRESSALPLMRMLILAGASVQYYDPYVPSVRLEDAGILHGVDLTDEVLAGADCVVIHTNHSSLPIERIVMKAALIYDTRNATRGLRGSGRLERFGDGTTG
ncbi:nucleotide sugar dehydrogenase [Paenibacillus kobensis]|uniref:nucleotide sugar dehydrogenase n=1 Tax=Paenibacillus kobensis TaxID=59841 RepID=UPI000FD999A1|nr:nucleotide sugar dehydrogenase [Paenibacillus kobensis]